MNLGKRIETAFDMAGVGTPEVARKTGVPAASINALMRRDSVRSNFTESILAVLPPHKVNIDWVRSGQGSPEPKQGTAPQAQKEATSNAAPRQAAAAVNVVHEAAGPTGTLKSWEHPQELPAGDWVFIPKLGILHDSHGKPDGVRTVRLTEEVRIFSAAWIRNDQLAPQGLTWHEVIDEAMYPIVCAGDSMVIDTGQKLPLVDGKTYAFWFGNGLRPRKVQLLPSGGVRLAPENPEFAAQEIAAGDMATLQIIGRVVAREGRGRL